MEELFQLEYIFANNMPMYFDTTKFHMIYSPIVSVAVRPFQLIIFNLSGNIYILGLRVECPVSNW